MEFVTYFRGVGTKRQFRPTTFRDHLERRKISSTKFFLQDIPLPTPQAWARGSRQFKQVVVVDVAVVVVLVEIVVDLHLFHLGMYIGHQSFKQPQYIFFQEKSELDCLLVRNGLPPVQLLQLQQIFKFGNNSHEIFMQLVIYL